VCGRGEGEKQRDGAGEWSEGGGEMEVVVLRVVLEEVRSRLWRVLGGS